MITLVEETPLPPDSVPGKPRADFQCAHCHEQFELPVAAVLCPCCQGPLERHWTPPHINRGVAKTVDRLVEQAAREMSSPSSPRPADTVRTLPAKFVHQGLSADTRHSSQTVAVPLLKKLGPPKPYFVGKEKE